MLLHLFRRLHISFSYTTNITHYYQCSNHQSIRTLVDLLVLDRMLSMLSSLNRFHTVMYHNSHKSIQLFRINHPDTYNLEVLAFLAHRLYIPPIKVHMFYISHDIANKRLRYQENNLINRSMSLTNLH
jgi:hypothetical protein